MMETKRSVWDECTNLYSLQKTLRFELKPLGKTLEFIRQKQLIEEDEERAKKFNNVKRIIDDYYRWLIEDSLKGVKISTVDLQEFTKAYALLKKDKSKDNEIKNQFLKIQKKIRNDIHKQFFKDIPEKSLFNKEILTNALPEWLQSKNREEDLKAVQEFKGWTTYFTGFFENRRNVFSKEEIHTSFIYRIVHDNLPKYIDNIERYEKLKEIGDFDDSQLLKDFAIELQNGTLSEFFTLDKFNECLNQSGIERFNLIIGGKSLKDNKKIPGLNELINLYSQKQSNDDKKKAVKKLFMLSLFKQILSDRTSSSFVLSAIKDDAEVISRIQEFYSIISKDFGTVQRIFKTLFEFDTDKVYINKKMLNDVSKKVYGDWTILEKCLKCYAKEQLDLSTEKKIEDWFKKQAYFSLKEIEQGIDCLRSEKVVKDQFFEYHSTISPDKKNLIDAIQLSYEALSSINVNKGERKLLTEQKELDVTKIKQFLDSAMELCHFLKPFYVATDPEAGNLAIEVDTEFYKDFNEVFERLDEVIPLYNKVRNYVTQKPFSTNKFKLNFRNSTLLSGWDKNKEKENWSVLLQRDGNYFLGIMTDERGGNKLFLKKFAGLESASAYKKIVYKLVPGPNKMLPKVFFSKKYIEYYAPSEDILRIVNHATHTKNGASREGYEKKEFSLADCHQIIDFYKKSIDKHPEWGSEFDFKFKNTTEYNDLSEFYRDVADQAYKIDYDIIPENVINKYVAEGKLYLFQIWSKDFSPHSKGRKNLHTLYWQELFSDENLRNVVFKLNGEAEVFFRRSSIDKRITHPKGIQIVNKNPIGDKKESNFGYDLVKDKRYTEDKFFFHCPITLNFKAGSSSSNKLINEKINGIIKKKHSDINILSIDRGERHLLYYTLLNPKGEILEQKSLNNVFDDVHRVHSYQDKLHTLESERKEARKAWKAIHNIKELKSGYLSQVVHHISKVAIEHNAVIVLEDINFGFKRGRFKVERQVYQKFEKMLIDKMNYLIFKERSPQTPGGILNAYQLTSKFEAFKRLGKQTGLLYYVNASYTSKICPKTGFVNMLHPDYTNVPSAKEFFSKFKSIRYNAGENYFEFSFRYADFPKHDAKTEYSRKVWTACSFGNRLVQQRQASTGTFKASELNLTDELRKLFSGNGISFDDGKNLVEQICAKDDKNFFERLLYLLKVTLQLRNTNSESGDDFILSCVKDKSGRFFDSRNAVTGEPQNADANGAYHIGLKGLLTMRKIKDDNENILVNNEEYFEFIAIRTQ